MSNPRLGSSQMMISPRGQNSLPADLNQAQPGFGGGSDGTPAALSIDNNGNLRVTINGASPVAGSTPIPVVIGIGDTVGAAGTAVAPAAGAPIVSVAVAAGTYLVDAIAGYGATADAINNMQLVQNITVVGVLFVLAAVQTQTKTRFWRVTVPVANNIQVQAVAAGGAGSVFIASLAITRVG